MKKNVYVLCLLLYAGFSVAQPEKIWIDTDIGIGKPVTDVDDGIALIMALRSPHVQIEGISLTGDVRYGYQISRQLLACYGKGSEIPLYRGAEKAAAPEQGSEAVEAMAEALRREALTIIALGPGTNIGSLLLLYPELKNRIRKIVWCAGRTAGLHFRPGYGRINVCDCNFDHDTRAGEIIVSSGVPLLLSGYEPASCIYLSKEDIMPLKYSSYEPDHWLYRQLSAWLLLWKVLLRSAKGFIPFDAITMGSFLHPEYMYFYHDIPLQVQVRKNDALFPFFKPRKPYLIASYAIDSPHRASYCYKADSSYKELLLRLLISRQPVEDSAAETTEIRPDR